MNPPRQPPEDDDDEFSGEPLTPSDNRRFRRMVRDEDRVGYLWTTIRLAITYVTAAIIAIGIATGYLKDFLKGLVK